MLHSKCLSIPLSSDHYRVKPTDRPLPLEIYTSAKRRAVVQCKTNRGSAREREVEEEKEKGGIKTSGNPESLHMRPTKSLVWRNRARAHVELLAASYIHLPPPRDACETRVRAQRN